MYTDSSIGHVLTGNLNIIRDRKLRKLIYKGPSYREQNNINWNTNLKNCLKPIKEYKNVLSVVPVLVVVYSHESLTALDMFDSDLWVPFLLPHYLIIPRKPTDNSGSIL